MCDSWLVFENFLANMGEPPPNMSIDRIDPNGTMSRATVAGLLTSSKPPIGDRSSKLGCVVNETPRRS